MPLHRRRLLLSFLSLFTLHSLHHLCLPHPTVVTSHQPHCRLAAIVNLSAVSSPFYLSPSLFPFLFTVTALPSSLASQPCRLSAVGTLPQPTTNFPSSFPIKVTRPPSNSLGLN
ncbi:hypothetical protein Droror1_Dr00010059 [Drosera rotundifolia]